MGACFSCCFGSQGSEKGGHVSGKEGDRVRMYSNEERAEMADARAKAAEAAEARASQFNNSAQGKAAKKAVLAAKDKGPVNNEPGMRWQYD